MVQRVKFTSYSSQSSSPWMYLRLLRKERELRVCDERILMYPVTVLMSPRKFSNSEAMLAREMEKSVSEQWAASVLQKLLCRRYSLPRRMLICRLPLITVQPLRDWAASTESMTFSSQILSHRPSQAVQNMLPDTQGQKDDQKVSPQNQPG